MTAIKVCKYSYGFIFVIILKTMGEIIKIVRDTPRVSTLVIAQYTNNENLSIIKIIDKFKNDFLEFGYIEEWKENLKCHLKWQIRKWKSKIYYLNEWQSTLLITYLRNNDIVREFKKKLVKEFMRFRNILNNLKITKLSSDYQQIRLEWKITRLNFTDTIKMLQYYATNKNPKATIRFMFSRYTSALNNWIFDIEGDFKNIREVCNIEQLKTLELLETQCSRIITEEIQKETAYKDIYYIVKEKIVWFAILFWKTKVIASIDYKPKTLLN